MIGQTLHHRYSITAELGRGAMGMVYVAADRTTRQKVALKIIADDLALEAEMLERFQREGEALRRLRHHNIVAFVEMFEHKGQQVIALEYVPGGNLAQRLRQGPLAPAQAAQMTLDLCDALTSAHRLDIIHRDIKPENILLAEDGTPKLTDFGVARLLGAGTRLTGTGTQVGTPYYMSPEAWEGKPLDAQADVWSLGVVLFEMLTGQVPFAGDTVVAVMNKVLNTPPPDAAQLRPDIPPALVKVVQRALTRDREVRYPTIRQMGADLEQALLAAKRAEPQAAPAEAPAPPPVPQPPQEIAPGVTRPAKAHPSRWMWLAGGAMVLVLLVAGGIGVAAIGSSFAQKGTPSPATATTLAVAANPTATLAPATPTLPAPTATPSATATARPSPTATPSPTPVPTETLTPEPTVTAGPTDTPLPTLNPSAGTVQGFVSWSEQGYGGATVKVCTKWLFSCQTQAYTAISNAQGFYKITDLPPGQYYIITKMPDQMDETRWGDPQPVVLKVIGGQAVQQDVTVYKHDLKLSSPGNGATVSGLAVTLRWKAYPGAARYRIRVGRSPGNNNCAQGDNEWATGTQLTAQLDPNTVGATCYWTVQAWPANGSQLSESPTYSFTVGP